MTRTITCSSHGVSRPAFVCSHLFAMLDDNAPRGVVWLRDEDGCINAYCEACDATLQAAGGEWTEELGAEAGVKLICEGCFQRMLSIQEQIGLG
jgi:hypothetical protein